MRQACRAERTRVGLELYRERCPSASRRATRPWARSRSGTRDRTFAPVSARAEEGTHVQRKNTVDGCVDRLEIVRHRVHDLVHGVTLRSELVRRESALALVDEQVCARPIRTQHGTTARDERLYNPVKSVLVFSVSAYDPATRGNFFAASSNASTSSSHVTPSRGELASAPTSRRTISPRVPSSKMLNAPASSSPPSRALSPNASPSRPASAPDSAVG